MLLTFLIFSPLLGLLALLFLKEKNKKRTRWSGVLSTLTPLILAWTTYIQVRAGRSYTSFSQQHEWFRFGYVENPTNLYAIQYEVGIDGFSLILLVLTATLSTLAAIASLSIQTGVRAYFSLFLLLEVGMLGVFTAQNLILFFIFFELTLIPMFLLIGKWGGFQREKAAYTFLLYNGIGSAILLVVIMTLFAKTGTSNFNLLTDILTNETITVLSPKEKWGVFLALLVAFAVKLPVFPLHTWMVRVHVQAPPPIVMLHAGVLLKIGAFGFIRFGMGLFPEEFASIAMIIVALGVVNVLYGAFLAWRQDDLRKVLAYSSISHMGIVLIGLGALNSAGIQGAMFQVISHGLISALLFFLVGLLLERAATTTISKLGGVASSMPIFGGVLLTGAMASLGLPGLSGFISEFMAFLGAFKQFPWLATVGTIGLIMTAVYMLRAVLSITFGRLNVSLVHQTDMAKTDIMVASIFLFFIITIGVYPNVLISVIQPSLQVILDGLGGG
ncbi:NADH-quinone oxidoreductase subunit M [Bacillus sp. CGMCC 1.16541]|uniref:complex I subunit 4 family protein n=1 Tax=Bacillus sp. CGMCC 1.16541 TaxID=2185143 RepID=UPI000D734734|nr:NADH-quinone oxidoreductase subunit M [Bacillus sp. CGMCC 1.16541]